MLSVPGMVFGVTRYSLFFHLEKHAFLSYETMRAPNICPGLKVNKHEVCGKNCVNKYCYTHNQQLRLGRKSPLPCRHCGVGTGSVTLLCRPCGAHRVARKLIDTEKRARRDYTLILA